MENKDFHLRIDSSIDLDTKVYRIVDFYSAADLVNVRSFMIPSAKNFEDSNDGIGQLLSSLFSTWPNAGCGVKWKNQEDLTSALDSNNNSSFVSCWSKNPESVAMWSLYSKDNCSVRIETTIGKLVNLCENIASEYNFGHFDNLKDGDSTCFIASAEIHAIKYRDLFSIASKIKRRVKARKRLEDRMKRNHEDVHKLGIPQSSKRDEFVDGLSSYDLRHLKDISFKHEEEIRVYIPIIESKLDQHFLDVIRKNNHEVNKRDKPFNHINKKLPERLFVNSPDDFIVSIAVDPRAPEHKKSFIENYFHKLDISITQSKCFRNAVPFIDVYHSEINPNF